MKDLTLKLILKSADKISGPFKKMTGASGGLQASIGKTADRLKELEGSSRDLVAFNRLKDQAGRNATALQQAQERAQQLGREMTGADKVTKRMASSFEAARNQVSKLKDQQAGLQQKVAGVSQKLRKQGISITDVATEQRKLGLRIGKTRQELDGYSASLDKARNKANRLAKARWQMDKSMAQKANIGIAGAAGVATGRTMLGAAGSILQPGINFEEQMSRVGALARVDKTSEDFKLLTDTAKKLGETTHFSASQAAEGMGFLAMAGFETSDILKTMPGLLNLAKAGSMDLGQTADIASNILSGFGLEAGEMGRVSDVLAATFTRSNVDLGMLGDTMKYVAPIARTIGVSIEEASAMAGLLGNVGIQGQQAGTALRAIQSRLAAPPKMAQDAIDQLGLSITDAQGNMLPLVDIMGQVAKKTEGMGNAVRLGFFKHIAGEEAGSAFAELVDKGGSEAITKFTDVLKSSGGEAERIASQMGDNSAGDLLAFSSAWEAVNISLTETNTSPLRELIQLGTGLLRTTNQWIKDNPVLAGTLFKVFAAAAIGITVLGGLALAVAGILGPFVMMKFAAAALGLKIFSFGGILTSIATTVFPLIATGFRILSAAMIANPVGAVIFGIATAASLIYAYWEPLGRFFGPLWDKAMAAFTRGWEWIKAIIDKISPLISAFTESLMAPFELVSKIGSSIGGAFDGLFGDDEEEAGGGKPLSTKIAAATIATTAVATPAIAGPSQVQNNQKYEIAIHAPAGADNQAIATAVRQEMERMNEEEAARHRSKLHD
ncbi:phage tail tape measure protein [Kiloniella laminariae]|uniref:Phage tail tape measure protein n=1 Tax=Kiloniella laminariae TaxID=454162 RepID=A0ABT4LKQ2_9PROT|nr:phage tail tape measure protein [Kiloniella laminariae]MCZ4281692.1 phage tail tape measure protein [Kiloniella laminariae]